MVVVDNGRGIEPDDLRSPCQSSTTKLQTRRSSHQYIGLRGEALASIGGVAQVTLQSRRPVSMSAEIHCDAASFRPFGLGTARPERASKSSTCSSIHRCAKNS